MYLDRYLGTVHVPLKTAVAIRKFCFWCVLGVKNMQFKSPPDHLGLLSTQGSPSGSLSKFFLSKDFAIKSFKIVAVHKLYYGFFVF